MPAKKKRKTVRKPSQKVDHDLEKGAEQFAEEMGKMGERFGSHSERKGKDMESWSHRTFGVVGPLLSSVFGVIVLALFLWVLNMINIPLGVGLLQNIHAFLAVHIGWFFLLFIFFSYTSYMSKASPYVYRPLSPIVSAAGITVAVWVMASAVRVVNISIGSGTLTSISAFLEGSLGVIFYALIIIGYLILIFSGAVKTHKRHVKEIPEEKPKKAVKAPYVHRLYRSGNDRILGGVCGGIAEYLGIDPVIIRLLWVIASLAWGSGILLYIILWIIMPRNPKHEWQ